MTTAVSPDESRSPLVDESKLSLLQGIIYVASGLWPVVHMRSFEAISGRKTDKWLVRTVGALIAVIGAVLLQARRRNRITDEVRLLAMGSAGSLAAIDYIYGVPGLIPRRYLLDGVMQSLFVACWAGCRPRQMGGPGTHPAEDAA